MRIRGSRLLIDMSGLIGIKEVLKHLGSHTPHPPEGEGPDALLQ